MDTFHMVAAALVPIVLFIYGLQGFSAQVREQGGEGLKRWLKGATAHRMPAFLIGAVSTALLQSSSAVTSMTVALVDSGALGFMESLGVLLGSNVGTTATAWLVSFKLSGMGMWALLLGALTGALPVKHAFLGKPIFYFGLILFALDLLTSAIAPWTKDPDLLRVMAYMSSPWSAILAGMVLTALIQSSSAVTGIAIVLVQQGLWTPENAIPLVLGSNVGSTATALLSSLALGAAARATAVTNLFFNASGLLLMAPILSSFATWMVSRVSSPSMAVAWAHLLFNLGLAVVFLPWTRTLGAAVARRFRL